MEISLRDQRKYAFYFGALALLLVFFSLIVIFLIKLDHSPRLWPFVEFFLRVTTSIAVAGVAAMLPGFFDIDWKQKLGIRAGGAFAVFLIVYTTNPPGLAQDYSAEIAKGDLYGSCSSNIRPGQKPSLEAQSACKILFDGYKNTSIAHLGIAQIKLSQAEYQEAFNHIAISQGLFFLEQGLTLYEAVGEVGIEPKVKGQAFDTLNVMQKLLWSFSGYEMQLEIIQAKVDAAILDSDQARLEKKLGLINTLSVAFDDETGLQSYLHSKAESLSSIWEMLYTSCILSWLGHIEMDPTLAGASDELYQEFRAQISKSTGTKALTQKHYLDCMEASKGQCEYWPGFPKSCPISDWM